jgi:hypothetical protein
MLGLPHEAKIHYAVGAKNLRLTHMKRLPTRLMNWLAPREL